MNSVALDGPRFDPFSRQLRKRGVETKVVVVGVHARLKVGSGLRAVQCTRCSHDLHNPAGAVGLYVPASTFHEQFHLSRTDPVGQRRTGSEIATRVVGGR